MNLGASLNSKLQFPHLLKQFVNNWECYHEISDGNLFGIQRLSLFHMLPTDKAGELYILLCWCLLKSIPKIYFNHKDGSEKCSRNLVKRSFKIFKVWIRTCDKLNFTIFMFH